jgi:hypothetical protein
MTRRPTVPQTIIMQGVTTLFAAVMTVTVINFPTPSDLREALRSTNEADAISLQSGGTEPLLPEPVDGNLTTDEVTSQLQACSDSLAAAVPYGLEDCRKTLVVSRDMIERTEVANDLRAKFDLTMALFCRVNWVEQTSEGEPFDVKTCKGVALALAE